MSSATTAPIGKVTKRRVSTSKGTMEDLTVLTYNVDTAIKDMPQRIKILIECLQNRDYDVVCLQEVFSSAMKEAITNGLEDQYYILSADHSAPFFPFQSFLPSMLLTIVANAFPPILRALAFIAAILVCPPVMRLASQYVFHCLQYASAFHSEGRSQPFDYMGLTILLNKKRFSDAQVECAEPFQVQGYTAPATGWGWIWLWVEWTFLRPGYLIVSGELSGAAGQILTIVDLHFVLGRERDCVNPNRKAQADEILWAVDQYSPKNSQVIVCGDLNCSAFTLDEDKMDHVELMMFSRNKYQDALKVFNPEAGRLPDDQMRKVITKALAARHRDGGVEKSQESKNSDKSADEKNDESLETEIADDEPKIQEISEDEAPLVAEDTVEETQDCKKVAELDSEVEESLERLKLPITWDGVNNPKTRISDPGAELRCDYVFLRDAPEPELRTIKLVEKEMRIVFDGLTSPAEGVAPLPIVSDHYGVQVSFALERVSS